MHHCLYVDEILRHVASELVVYKGRASAVALACCCKSFEDPVLDVLWETQEGLIPLFGSLPRDVWNGGVGALTYPLSVHSTTHPQPFRRLPTKLEWARFRGYTRRMRRLELYGPLPPLSQAFTVLQFCAFGEPLLPNLKSLVLAHVAENLVPFIPLFLSPGTSSIDLGFKHGFPEVMAASVVTALPTLCPDLQAISLNVLPRDSTMTAAVSEMLLATNRDTLQQLDLLSPLTEEVSEAICNLPNLRKLRVVIEGSGSLPTLVLPNLTEIDVEHDHDHDWLQGFRGATFGKLISVAFHCRSSSISDFLKAFESVALTTSIPTTLSMFMFYPSTLCSWKPNYCSLLPFTQLKKLVIGFSCRPNCSSTIDDDIMTDLARAMPKLEILRFGNSPCQAPTGVTAKGLATLAYYCPRLSDLCVHFQVAGLDPSEIPQVTSDDEPTIPLEECALTCLQAGSICIPEESASTVALALLRIFPRLNNILYMDQRWKKVVDAISVSKKTC